MNSDTCQVWKGKRIYLRAVEPADWKYFLEWNKDPEFSRNTYSVDFPMSRERIIKWTYDSALAGPDNGAYRWMIENQKRVVVGTINTHTCNQRMGTFRYGIMLRRRFFGRGYASDAILTVLKYYFYELRYQKVNVEIFAFNAASLKMHLNLGFKEEGRLRRMIYSGGRYHDDYILGMTAEEFKRALKD